jgi:tetratricopeptide (TPR) repeat protein
MKVVDGLYAYEVVMMVLGVLLFLALVFAFVVLVMRGKSYAKLLAFFAVPVVMVGFPGLKSFEFSEGAVKVEKLTRALEENPTDKNVRKSLEQEVADVSARPSTDPQVAVSVARAHIALGDDTAAQAKISKALKEAPKLRPALELRKRIELDRNLVALTSQVKQNPDDTAAQARLEETAAKVAQLPIASPGALTRLARAQEALGEQAKAEANVNKALRIDPNLAPAIKLREQMETITVPPRPDNP